MTPLAGLARALTLGLFILASAAPARADEAERLAQGLSAVAAQDWAAALASGDQAGPVGRDIIRWFWLRAGEGRLGDYEDFLARNADWPGLRGLRERGEEAAARSDDPARILRYFDAYQPRSAKGAIALVQALAATGQAQAAQDSAARAWASLVFGPEDETALAALAGPAMATADELRLDNLLWEGGRADEVQRLLPRLGADLQALAKARLALRAGSDKAPALVQAVPEHLAADPGLAYDRFVYRMKQDRYDDARAFLLEVSTSAEALGRPEAWAERRALLARRMMRQDEPKNAYRIASRHFLPPESQAYADLEFLAGFIALRRLGDPDLALKHFGHLKGAVATPISLARADYWIARAAEAKGDAAGAKAAYQAAARHQSAYYGLLAGQRLGLSLDISLANPAPPSGSINPAQGSSVLAAAILLAKAGDRTTSKRFFLHLGESLSDEERAALSELALDLDEPHIALLIAKQAAERGLILPRAYYPVPDFVPEADLPVSRALILSITRRESEFDPGARSSVGARGLMQVMPDTADLMAAELGIDHQTGWLTSRPDHNIRLGAAYLAHLVERFGPSVALIASGYNAGPRRPEQWIKDFGDPRSASAEGVVDWVEMIPFTETRTYVMRVAESLVIYRARLKGASAPITLIEELRGG